MAAEGVKTKAVVVAVVASAGRTGTSRSAIETRLSIFAPTGSCWRRSTTTVWAS